jgi:hypothetical protein
MHPTRRQLIGNRMFSSSIKGQPYAWGVIALLASLLFSISRLAGAQGLTTADITDPAYGVKAFTITIPAGWKFEGTVMPGPDCSDIPYPVFRAYSRDGLSEIRLMPAFNWSFHPNLKNFHSPMGCLDFGHTLTAEEFLKHYEEMVAANGMHVVGPMPVGAAYQKRVAGVANNMNHISPNIQGSATGAAIRVETLNGSFTIEQRLRVYVECRVNNGAGGMSGGACSAHVDVVRAPKGKLDALCAIVDAHDLVRTPHEDAWLQRVQQTITQKNQDRMRQLTHQEQASSAMLKKQADDFNASAQRNHEAFMAQQESSYRTHQAQMAQQASSFHSSMNAANDAMNARTTAASDWVDYALDQQTVTGQGGTQKVSSAYSHTWSSTVGNQTQWYQTNDPNANPNGALYGNWTEDTKVHGNGQPQ